MAKKDSGRYEAKYSKDSFDLEDAALAVATSGLTLLTLAAPKSVECKLTDKETGKSHSGYGGSKEKAHNEAYSKFKK